jgi:hypothetical protein
MGASRNKRLQSVRYRTVLTQLLSRSPEENAFRLEVVIRPRVMGLVSEPKKKRSGAVCPPLRNEYSTANRRHLMYWNWRGST